MILRGASYRSSAQPLAIMLGLCLVASGCGGGSETSTKGKSKPQVAASGKVTYDGKPLESGVVTFTSVDTGNAVTATVTNGEFSLKAAEGPNPGENSVQVAGKEKADGPAVWLWASKTTVPEGGFTGDFAIDPKSTRPAPKPNPDD